MANMTPNFGTNTAATVTNLHSRTDAQYWQSATIDTSSAIWCEVFVTIKTVTSAAADALGYIQLFISASNDGGTDFAGGASGTESQYTPDTVGQGTKDPRHFRLLGTQSCDNSHTAAVTYKYHFVFGDVPEDLAFVIYNGSGQSFAADTNAVEYKLNGYTST